MASSGYPNIPPSDPEETSVDHTAKTSASPVKGSSRPPREKHRVRFTPGGESLDDRNVRAVFDVEDGVSPAAGKRATTRMPRPQVKPLHTPDDTLSSKAQRSDSLISLDITNSCPQDSLAEARPSFKRSSLVDPEVSDNQDELHGEAEDEFAAEKAVSQRFAQERAERLSSSIASHSDPGGNVLPPRRSPRGTSPSSNPAGLPLDFNNIPLERLQSRRKFGIEDDSDEDDEADYSRPTQKQNRFKAAARKLVRHHTSKDSGASFRVQASSLGLQSGQVTPVYEQKADGYVPRPTEYREGFLSSILKLYGDQGAGPVLAAIPGGRTAVARASRQNSIGESPRDSPSSREAPSHSPGSSGHSTPKLQHQKWYQTASPGSTGSIANLVSSTTMLAQPATPRAASDHSSAIKPAPKQRLSANGPLDMIFGRGKERKVEETIRIERHIAETLSRQTYLKDLCKALMQYGAPTHRLEEYMRMSSRVLEIDGQFLYIPGCMIISFDDKASHTAEVSLVRASQGVDLGRLRDVHEIYKEVVHDLVGVDDAMIRLDELMKKAPRYGPWLRVLVYGLASACVGPFAFDARPIDLPFAFVLGSLLGFMQLILAPKSDLYANIFEISAAVFTSFFARLLGSLPGGHFCFSALAQSAIALILPGYTVLCGSLELQSRNIVAGSVRMVYAIIYSLFLGFGITIGTSFYGGIYKNATSAVTCSNPVQAVWYPFIFVPPFTLCLIIINQGQRKQMPVMIILAFIGYVVNHFSALRFASNAQIANTLGAFAIGLLGNIYSRCFHGLAAAALLPAIFVQVPSGLAASGSLVSGVTSANQITNHSVSGTTTVSNATQAGAANVDVNTMVFNVGYSMIQVAIGITVGLFLSALVVYPFGKKRSGLFSF